MNSLEENLQARTTDNEQAEELIVLKAKIYISTISNFHEVIFLISSRSYECTRRGTIGPELPKWPCMKKYC